MSLLLSLLGLSMIGEPPRQTCAFKIRPSGPSRCDVIELTSIGEVRICSLNTIPQAKAFRTALDWAINDQGMNNYTAILYADRRAHEETTACLETNEPDEHFV